MFSRLGKILVSGPSNVAITNAAARIYDVSATVARQYNKGRPSEEWACRRLVVRVYAHNIEEAAFMHLLEHPHDVENAGGRHSNFQLTYSRAYWLMVLFGATDIGRLEDDDARALHGMQQAMLSRPDLTPIFQRVSGQLSWEEYLAARTGGHEDQLSSLFDHVLDIADFVCPTPACSENNHNIRDWKKGKARGVIIDEAANMNRADLACVWGNCLLPCFLVGDPKQLPPTVMSARETDTEGFLVNRLTEDGRLSPLEMLQASGIPVYRLHVQLRMPKALFDTVRREFYRDVPFTYAPWCDITLPAFAPGRILEAFAQARYPDLRPPPEGTFSPIFINCEGSRVFRNEMTLSKRCPGQVNVALDFIADLVGAGVQPAKVTLLAPYAANALHAEFRRREKYRKLLADMPPACTIDGYQGQENDIIVVVFGTNQFHGVGFTAQAQRLNVLLTRARCGLVLVGDLKAVEKKKGKGNKEGDKQIELGPNGETVFMNVKSIRNIYRELEEDGRVATVSAGAKAREGEADEANPVEEGKKRKVDDADPFEEEKAAEAEPSTKKKKKKKNKKKKAEAKAATKEEEEEEEKRDEGKEGVDAEMPETDK